MTDAVDEVAVDIATEHVAPDDNFAELNAKDATGGGGQSTIPPIAGFNPTTTAQNTPNIFKAHNNWNYFYTCGHDIEDGHMSKTCPVE
jgi:hypothetical protein